MEFCGSSNHSGMRGTKRRTSEGIREEGKSSKEPMLMSSDHLVAPTSNTGGVGVLHQLLGPPHTPSVVTNQNPLSVHHSTHPSQQSVSDSSFTAAVVESEGQQRMARGLPPLSVATLQQQQFGQLLPSPPSAATATVATASVVTPMNISACPPAPGPGLASTSSVSSTPQSSKLCEKNKMLASLLAKQPMQSSLSTSIASPKPSALPQEKLPKDLKVSELVVVLRVK